MFVYTVEFGDTISGAVLEVDTRSAIRGGDAPLVDLLGREANVTLPEMGSDATLSETAAVSIDSAEPFVVGIGSSLAGGEYGVGQVKAGGGHVYRILSRGIVAILAHSLAVVILFMACTPEHVFNALY